MLAHIVSSFFVLAKVIHPISPLSAIVLPFQDSNSVASSTVPAVRVIAASLLKFIMNSGEWHVPQNEQSRMTQDSAKLYL